MLIGSHVHGDDPLAAAHADGADVLQFFLGNPQSWKKPKPREDADMLKAASTPIYVHAPYLINVASANNRVRIPSRKILQDTCDAAADVGATAGAQPPPGGRGRHVHACTYNRCRAPEERPPYRRSLTYRPPRPR